MFIKLRALLGLDEKADVSAITPEQMSAAEAKITQLETATATAQAAVAVATAAQAAAEALAATAAADLKTARAEVATLEAWKKGQAAEDGRQEDEANHDGSGAPALESWERTAAGYVARAKKRHGEQK